MLYYTTIPRKIPTSGEVKYYGQLVNTLPIGLDEISRIISAQCTVTMHDVKAVLSALEEQIYMNLRNGRSIRLGDVGSFHINMKSKGELVEKNWNVAHVQSLRVRFYPSKRMKTELSRTNAAISFRRQTPTEGSTPLGPGGSFEGPSGPGDASEGHM